MKAIVCLPTMNEVESVGMMIDKIRALELEVFVCDAHSSDGTREIALDKGVEVVLRDKSRLGYGAGIMNAIDTASSKGFEVLVILDCDITYPVNKIPDLLRFIPEYDVIIGIRDFQDITFLRRFANRVHTYFANILFGSHFSDINSGMRVFKINKFKGKLDAPRMGLVAQMSCYAFKNKLHIKEHTIKYNKRIGSSTVSFIDGIDILWTILRERFR